MFNNLGMKKSPTVDHVLNHILEELRNSIRGLDDQCYLYSTELSQLKIKTKRDKKLTLLEMYVSL